MIVDNEPCEATPKQRGRKRVRNIKYWKKNIRKRRRQSGKEYVSSTGKTVEAKRFRLVDCRCPLKCSEKITNERQQSLHKSFYASGDWSLQSAYINGHVRVEEKRRTYTKSENSRRSTSKYYYLSNIDGIDIRVCKEFFKGVLTISDGRIARVTKKKVSGTPIADQRGKHVPYNKTPDADV